MSASEIWIFPVEALLASTRSSVSVFRCWDFWSRTFRYSRSFGSFGAVRFMRST